MEGKLLPCIAVALTLFPASALAYNFDPLSEPDSVHDSSEHMFPDRALFGEAGVDRIYFDAVAQGFPGIVGGASLPYNGVTVPGAKDEGRVLGPVAIVNTAYLGFWRDCNHDGYVGEKTTGFAAYRSASYDRDLCDAAPFVETVAGEPAPRIHEFIWIGALDPDGYEPQELTAGAPVGLIDESTLVNDPDARVWGDWMRPHETAPQAPGLFPLPPGTLSTVGGHLLYADALTQGALSRLFSESGQDALWLAVTCREDDPDTPGAYPDKPCGLNQPNPVGYYAREAYNNRVSATNGERDRYDHDGASAWVRVDWDCENTTDVPLLGKVATPGSVDPNFDTEEDNPPYGSLTGQYREVDYGLGETSGSGKWECDRHPEELPFGHTSLEERTQFSSLPAKDRHDFAYRFVPRTVLTGPGGEHLVEDETGYVDWQATGGYWFGQESWVLALRRASYGNWDQAHTTSYARITSASFSEGLGRVEESTPLGALNPHEYGQEGCTALNGPGILSIPGPDGVPGTWDDPSIPNWATGWECNAGVWTYQRTTSETPDAASLRVDLGEDYTFRDIDCYDNYTGVTAEGEPVLLGIAPECAPYAGG